MTGNGQGGMFSFLVGTFSSHSLRDNDGGCGTAGCSRLVMDDSQETFFVLVVFVFCLFFSGKEPTSDN